MARDGNAFHFYHYVASSSMCLVNRIQFCLLCVWSTIPVSPFFILYIIFFSCFKLESVMFWHTTLHFLFMLLYNWHWIFRLNANSILSNKCLSFFTLDSKKKGEREPSSKWRLTGLTNWLRCLCEWSFILDYVCACVVWQHHNFHCRANLNVHIYQMTFGSHCLFRTSSSSSFTSSMINYDACTH